VTLTFEYSLIFHGVIITKIIYTSKDGRAIAQAVSRRLPTAVAGVRAQVSLCGICGRQSGAGVGFLRVFRFPLPIFIPPISPQSPSSIIWGWYNRPVVAAVPSGLSLTPLRIVIILLTMKIFLHLLMHLSSITMKAYGGVELWLHHSSPRH
jgi:hypothetical protein